MDIKKTAEKIGAHQKKIYLFLITAIALTVFLLFFLSPKNEMPPNFRSEKKQFDVVSKEVKPESVRLSHLEGISDVLNDRLHSLETSVLHLQETNQILENEKEELAKETGILREQLESVQLESQKVVPSEIATERLSDEEAPSVKIWEVESSTDDHHVSFEIPAGTVVKALLVSGVDCTVAVHKPTGPSMVLLQPLDNGKLPKKVRVPLKGSVIIGNAIGDLASERVYIRAERMTLVEHGGSFIETEVSAYISGEDGREGVRGVVVDRSGQIITRAAFAAFLQGISQTIQATLNNQTIEKLAATNADKTILDIDLYRNSALQGGATALNKLADYYIKRAEQLQPAIQIAAGRIVDIVFTKTVRVGEKNLKQKLEHERTATLSQTRGGANG